MHPTRRAAVPVTKLSASAAAQPAGSSISSFLIERLFIAGFRNLAF